MKVLGNGLLARNFSFYSLRLNDTGLYYVNRGTNDTHEIFITNDPAKILSLMDLKFEDIDGIGMEKFFEILLGCEYFKTKRFTEDISEGGNLLLSKFAEYLVNVEFNPAYTKITKERVLELVGTYEFGEKLYKSIIVLNKEFKHFAKLDGKLILKYHPSYDKRRFSTTFPYFMNSFVDDIDRDYFLKTTTEQNLVNKFMEVTYNV